MLQKCNRNAEMLRKSTEKHKLRNFALSIDISQFHFSLHFQNVNIRLLVQNIQGGSTVTNKEKSSVLSSTEPQTLECNIKY